MSILTRPTLLVVALFALTIGALFIAEGDTAMAAGPADLRLDMASSDPLPAPGEQVTIRARARNMGPNTAENAQVVFDLSTYSFDGFCNYSTKVVGGKIVRECTPTANPPAGVTCVYDDGADTLTCDIAKLGSSSVPGSGPTSVLISFLATAEPTPDGRPYVSGVITNTSGPDPNLRNNAARASTNSLP